MGYLNKNDIFQEGRLKTEVVSLKSGNVVISEISGPDYVKLYSDPKNQKKTGVKLIIDGKEEEETTIDMGRFQAALITYGAVDEKGKRIFDDSDIDEVARLAQGPFLKLAEAARNVNGMNGEEVKNSDDNQGELPFSG